MKRKRLIRVVTIGASVALAAWMLTLGLERLMTPESVEVPDESPRAAADVAHISATLFLGSEDGQFLVTLKREVPFADSVVEQGRQIVTAQLQADQSPYVSPIPPGTSLRAFYVTDRGDAFVDLSAEATKAHPGGSTTELLTVYAIVNAVTANLPTIKRVQVLIEGKEVDTLAGHIDLRRPLEQNTSLVRMEEAH